MSKLRLDKYLADMGVGTRQEVKALVRKGRVAVDGITAKAPELKVDPDEAQVTVDGNRGGEDGGKKIQRGLSPEKRRKGER